MQGVGHLVLIASLSLPPAQAVVPAEGKTVEAQFKQAYEGKQLTLRDFYKGRRLKYNSNGQLIKGGSPGAWTLYGLVEVRSVRVKKKSLELLANRIFVRFEGGRQLYYRSPHHVWIEVDYSDTGNLIQAHRQAFPRIFLAPGEQLTDLVPPYWQKYFETLAKKDGEPPRETIAKQEKGSEGVQAAPAQDAVEAEKKAERVGELLVYRIGGEVPPRCLSCKEPAYSPEALQARVEGTVILWCIVNESGRAGNLRIAKAVGMGLDDAAVEAVRNWEFEPARRNGRAVAVYMAVEVNFHL